MKAFLKLNRIPLLLFDINTYMTFKCLSQLKKPRKRGHKMMAIATNFFLVASCGYLGPPDGGRKFGTVYLDQSTVAFECSEGLIMTGSAARKCVDGVWQGNATVCSK